MFEAHRIRVSGLVQGVGFRPFVWRLARELELSGWVRNDDLGVEISAEGGVGQLAALIERLRSAAPPAARVDSLAVEATPTAGVRDFVIAPSIGSGVATSIGPDTAPCADCLDEMFSPLTRRWRHPFINCTQCGPRYTLTRSLPYDRSRTSMAQFAMCPDCAREYADPGDRRFHAEPVCCPRCGPTLHFDCVPAGEAGADPVAGALAQLQAGAILAIQGLGGYHLACDARNAEAVARLRARKQRDAKPFAVMGVSCEALMAVAALGPAERALLESPSRPIVLCRSQGEVLPGIAPGLAHLGLMLPSTPIHWLLWHEAAGRPAGTCWLEDPPSLLLVMTSANPGGEPIVADRTAARARLAAIADGYLEHDRDIVARCDDSVVAPHAVIRRARGAVPDPIRLAHSGPSVLALGAWFNTTICLTRGDEAFVSPHIGDLDNAATVCQLEQTIDHLQEIAGITPIALACDLHPDFPSSRLAERWSLRAGIPLHRVQHHHAHIAAALAEHHVEGAVLGLAIDGVGLGTDGAAWGGELLRVDGAHCARLASLVPLPLAGGDRAALEPWRMAAAVLWRCGRGEQIPQRFASFAAARSLTQLFERPALTPSSSSLGRVFDAAAALLGVRLRNDYEGHAAMELESLALRHGDLAPWPDGWKISDNGSLDLLPLLARLIDEPDRGYGAALFHATLVQALAAWIRFHTVRESLSTVVGGGGCLLNAILVRKLKQALADDNLGWHYARKLPPNDGGLSLGQAWVARLMEGNAHVPGSTGSNC